jgi:ABC-type multidrug transport system fused ATPase/permease subunit
MDDLLPADPKRRRMALIVWALGAVLGTMAVWWLSSYLDTLTELARTDREASLRLFRTRVLPALIVVVLVAVVSGALLIRYGLQIMRTRHFPPAGAGLVRPTSAQTGAAARAIGFFVAFVGFLLAAIPLGTIAIVLWLLRGA